MTRTAVLIALLAISAGPVAAGDNLAAIFGIGQRSCAYWLADQGSEYAGSIWILGYWSGYNHAGSFDDRGFVGASTDANGIIGEVKKRCEVNPSSSLISEVGKLYFEFREAGR